MATAAELPVNGSYAQQDYDGSNYANNAPSYSASASQPAQSSNTAASEIPKDEVGWYFVEQYYTTLSRSPDKLYLFYNKRSQFVSGNEEDKVNVCVGQKAINDRIKDLDFHDTKVRVTNVDSQGSDANIVIQVIGEISNKGQPHKRFAQTFVLAEQTNGYFVLNDIFRYLAEEPEDEEEVQQDASAPAASVPEPAPAAAAPENAGLNQSDEIANTEEDLAKVDHKLEETAQEEPAREASPPAAATNGTP
ncbi:NTF2-like protein, partial [Karstenula rhodostoma CBS 690.94]